MQETLRTTLGLASFAIGLGCSDATSPPTLQFYDQRVLFIGNSYTFTNDLPGMLQGLAAAAGDTMHVVEVTFPDYALVDHWNDGIAQDEIAKGNWTFVVLQQGPSSVAINRDSLRMLTRWFTDEMAKVGARPALFSAWPRESRVQDFPAAIESYRLAAQDVSGVFVPIASAWLAAWERLPGLQLYSDGLHPTIEGTYLSALVMYGALTGKSPIGLPNSFLTRSGPVTIDAGRALQLREAATSVLEVGSLP